MVQHFRLVLVHITNKLHPLVHNHMMHTGASFENRNQFLTLGNVLENKAIIKNTGIWRYLLHEIYGKKN